MIDFGNVERVGRGHPENRQKDAGRKILAGEQFYDALNVNAVIWVLHRGGVNRDKELSQIKTLRVGPLEVHGEDRRRTNRVRPKTHGELRLFKQRGLGNFFSIPGRLRGRRSSFSAHEQCLGLRPHCWFWTLN